MLDYRKALIPGSFDPVTVGHYDIVQRASRMFDKVFVVAFVNASKSGQFAPEQRLAMLKRAFRDLPNVEVDMSEGLLADYARKHGIGTLVKGARNATDFDYEMSMSLVNRSIDSELDTVVIPTRAEYMHVSSTMVRELIKYGCDFSHAVPDGVTEIIQKM